MIRTLNEREQKSILKNNYIGNLAYIFKEKPFIVPITYFYDEKNNVIMGYSSEGHKITAMRRHKNVCLNVSEIESVNTWKSIKVQGTYLELTEGEATAQLHEFSLGVKDLIIKKEHRKLDFISEFSSKIYKGNLPIVFQIKIEEITGKMRKH
ncbi:pyridoxamine 5'-phosphate oxidase family protein [uncultured Winogradskyella sp.]|uniref:pyridoxamine 5'-phosphate oxidase family protein n=1 Tax=uncultured Winogradskyella sp. TaxID=395353 RepID=UPI0030D9872B|tara:strand:- start:72639 stop:73094 length:456 start_codon:yes stop_codon:yes gene_type:complete